MKPTVAAIGRRVAREDRAVRKELLEIGEALTEIGAASKPVDGTRVGDLLYRLAVVYGRQIDEMRPHLAGFAVAYPGRLVRR